MMNTITDSYLSGIDRLITKFVPVNVLVNFVVDKIAPKTVAKACHGGQSTCSTRRGGSCYWGCSGCLKLQWYDEIVTYGSSCQYTCTNHCAWYEFIPGCCPGCSGCVE